MLRRPIPNTATTEKLKLVCHSVQQDGGRDSGYSRAQDRKIRRSSAMARSGFGRDGTLRHLGLDAAAIARAPAHSARHCPADCDASPATDRRPPCRSLPVRACRLPACPASVFACLLCGQAGPHSPRTTSRDAPGRAAGVTVSVYGVCTDSVYGAIRPAPKPARRPLTYKTARTTNRRWGRPAAEAAQCEGRRYGGATAAMMMASPWKPSHQWDPAA